MDSDVANARIGADTKKDIENALKKLTTAELYEVVSEMKMLIQRDRDHAKGLLESKPVLAQALLTAQIMLGMAQVSSTDADSSMAPGATEDASNMENLQQQVLDGVLALTEEQIQSLSPEQQAQVVELRRAAAARQGGVP